MDRAIEPKFSFVNLNHPDELKDGEMQARIRHLAMRSSANASRKQRTEKRHDAIVPHPHNSPGEPLGLERLGASQTNPFNPYPIELNDSDRNLLAYSR